MANYGFMSEICQLCKNPIQNKPVNSLVINGREYKCVVHEGCGHVFSQYMEGFKKNVIDKTGIDDYGFNCYVLGYFHGTAHIKL